MPEAEDEIVELIYSAAAEPGLWPQVCGKVRELVGAHESLLFSPFLPVKDGGLWEGALLLDIMEDYGRYYVHVDPWLQSGIAKGIFTPGRVVTGEALLTDAEWARSEYYVDVMRGYDIGRLLSTLLTDPGSDGSGATTFCLFRGRVPGSGVGAVGKRPVAATVTSQAATGRLSTAVVIADRR